METKKNANHSLENKRFLFFQLGLIISLGFVFLAFEWTSYYKQHTFTPIEKGVAEDFVIPNTFFTEPKVEAPKINKQKITQSMQFVAVPNNTTITPDNTLTPNPVTTNANLIPIEPENIDEPEGPVYQAEHFAHAKTCKSIEDEEQRKQCTFDEINSVLRKNLKYPADMKKAGIEGMVYLKFVIDKTGDITNIEVLRAPHKQLSNEAIRVLKLLPEFVPAKQNGRTVSQFYTLPISFKLNG